MSCACAYACTCTPRAHASHPACPRPHLQCHSLRSPQHYHTRTHAHTHTHTCRHTPHTHHSIVGCLSPCQYVPQVNVPLCIAREHVAPVHEHLQKKTCKVKVCMCVNVCVWYGVYVCGVCICCCVCYGTPWLLVGHDGRGILQCVCVCARARATYSWYAPSAIACERAAPTHGDLCAMVCGCEDPHSHTHT